METKETPLPMPGAKLAAALSKAHSEFKPIVKNKHVDFTPKTGNRVKYSYADLSDVIDSVKDGLSKNELAIINELNYINSIFTLKTILVHSSGEFIETFYPLPNPVSTRAQEFGSALTYARRYSLSTLLNIASEDDDDGQGAPEPDNKKPMQYPNVPTQVPPRPQPKQQVKNYAPGAQNQQSEPIPSQDIPEVLKDDEDLNQALGEPEYLDPQPTKLDYLYQKVEEYQIPHEDVKKAIKIACGHLKKSDQLTDAELDKVLKYLHLDKKPDDNR